jgi:LmbE family N-acetylglucosaminyl deacetylase
LETTPVPAPQRLNILVLSPHRNDAAFSLALSLAAWRKAGHAVTLLNAVTRSIDAPFSDADSLHENDRLSYVSAMRKREDEAFLRLIPGITLIDANIKDAPLRRHCAPEDVYTLPFDPNDSAAFKIGKHLTRHLTQPNPVFALPLALGGHIDHRIAREAAATLAADLPCAFYEDLPDAFREASIPDEQPNLTPILTAGPNPLAWKRKAILLYSSQIETETADRILDHAHSHNDTERLWANDAFSRLIGN